VYDPRAILVEVASYAEPLKNRVGFTCKRRWAITGQD
jgi:hypothetical protein